MALDANLIREILHWIVEEVTVPHYARASADRPTPADVRQKIDDATGYVPPKPALTPEQQAQLAQLQEIQRKADEARADQAAGVENVDDTGN